MANTTNFNWETPDDTDLVKDGAAAIRTLGSSIDTTTKNLNPQTTTGALAYRSATANVNTALPLGTAGQVLQVNSGATAPEWTTPASGGFTFAAYTPTYTNFTLGNGTVIARYAESGKLVFFQVQITFGSTTSVSGLIKISLPVTAKNNGNAVTIPALFTDAGLNEYIGFGAINQTDNVVSLFAEDASATYLKYALTSSTVPFTWGTADVINVSGSYEAN